MRGLVAPRSTLDRLAGIGLILDWFGCERTVLVDYRLCRREEGRKYRGGVSNLCKKTPCEREPLRELHGLQAITMLYNSIANSGWLAIGST